MKAIIRPEKLGNRTVYVVYAEGLYQNHFEYLSAACCFCALEGFDFEVQNG